MRGYPQHPVPVLPRTPHPFSDSTFLKKTHNFYPICFAGFVIFDTIVLATFLHARYLLYSIKFESCGVTLPPNNIISHNAPTLLGTQVQACQRWTGC